MRSKFVVGAIALAAGALPAAASAAPASTLDGAQVFAGPGDDYPVVAQFGPGVIVNVNGCLADRSWCDVSFDGNRGWVYAGDLAYDNVSLLQYGPSFPLPTLTFSLGDYWGRYYRGRPFYSQRQRWEGHGEGRMPAYRRDEIRDHGNGGYENRRYESRGNEHGNDFRGSNELRRGNDFRSQRGQAHESADRQHVDRGDTSAGRRDGGEERSGGREERGSDRGTRGGENQQ